MNVKAVLMLCLIIFAFASTIATITIAFGTRTPDVFGIKRTIVYNIESRQVEPMIGDPIGGDFPPG